MIKSDHSKLNSIPPKVTISLIGDPGAGKTSIKNKLLGKSFSSKELMTVGADFSFLDYKIDRSKFKLKLCDIAGQQSFAAIRSNYMAMSDAALLIFDLTNPISLENSVEWFEEYLKANEKNKKTNLPVLMLGNKLDLEEHRKVSLKMVKSVLQLIEKENELQRHLIGYLECSAKTGENIHKGIEQLAKSIKILE